MSTPHAKVKAKFESKDKLVAAVQELATEDLWMPRLSSDRAGDEGAKGLARVSNAKLLRLHETLSTVKEKFGTRGKLIDSVLELEGRSKDSGYRSRLEGYPVPRLYDMFRAGSRKGKNKGPAPTRAGIGSPAAEAAAPAKKKAAKKATAKKATAKKAASDE
jgi:hypothetical protein